jgi:hypothetical protein
MADKKLVDYIEKVMKKGFTLDQARVKLEDAHYPESKIKEAVSQVKKRKVWKTSEIVFAIILVIAVLSVFADKVLFKEEVVSEEPIMDESDLLKQAMREKNPVLCEQLSNSVERQLCIQSASSSQVVNINNVEERKTLNQVLTENSSGCESLKNSVEKTLCEGGGSIITPPVQSEPESLIEGESFEQEPESNEPCSQFTNPVEKNLCLKAN